MATIDVGKIKFTWKGAYTAATTYEADDVVSYSGDSYIYVNATAAAGQTPADNSYWDVMAEGSNPMTASGDVVVGGSGGSATRLPIGQSSQVLKVTGSDSVGWGNTEGLEGWVPLGTNIPQHADVTSADPKVSRPWLARYSGKSGATEDYIPYDGMPNTHCGPAKRQQSGNYHAGIEYFSYINANNEIMYRGIDNYGLGGAAGVTHATGACMPIHMEFGGLESGEYFVRIWNRYYSHFALTNKGNLFVRGVNTNNQLGLGDSLNRHQWVRNPYLGPNATNNGISCEVATFVHGGNLIASNNDQVNGFAILHDGRVLAWGGNNSGSLGIGDSTTTNIPELVTNLSSVETLTIFSGYAFTMFLDADGDVWSTGGALNSQVAKTSPVVMAGVDNVSTLHAMISTSYFSAHAIQSDGTTYAIGENSSGILGVGDTTDRSAWTLSGGSLRFSYVTYSGGDTSISSAAISGSPGDMSNGLGKTVYFTGYNANGALAQGDTTNTSSWNQPQTVSWNTSWIKTVESADGNLQNTNNLTLPRTEIVDVVSCQSASSTAFVMTDVQQRQWYTGYFGTFYGNDNDTGNATLTNAYMYPSPWSHTRSTGTGYAGKAQVEVADRFNFNGSSGAIWIIRGTDNSLWYRGGNYSGIVSTADTGYAGSTIGRGYITHWIRMGAA